jgi:Subtilase family/PhoD-like phosphatase
MVFQHLGCKIVTWFLILAVVGLAISGTLNYLWLGSQYAEEPADQWLLVGGVTSTSASFRIRLGYPRTTGDDDSRLVIAQDQALTQVVSEHSLLLLTQEEEAAGTTNTSSDSEKNPASNPQYGIHAITVMDLQPEQRFYYGVRSSLYDDGTSFLLTGTFQTPAPEGTAFNFTIAAAGCAWTGSQHSIFDVIREDHPDLQFFLHLGDFHYEDLNTVILTERFDAISTVLKSEQQANLFRHVPLVYTWDDHDYLGDDDTDSPLEATSVRETAQQSYQQAFPHYPLAAAALDNNNNNSTIKTNNIPIYHAFTMGTVRFIVSDLQSDRTNSSIYSAKQQDWLFEELQQADQYDFVVWITSKPWIGTETEATASTVSGSWLDTTFADNRRDLSNHIAQTLGGEDGPRNLLVIAGDAHMVAFDDGTNTYYGDDGNGAYSFPILQTAPLDRLGSTKGGPFSDGCWSYENERNHMYSTLSFSNEEDSACVQIESFRVDEWNSKETIFQRRLCGKIFGSGIAPGTTPVADQKCSIQYASETSQIFAIVGAAVMLLLASGTCSVLCCDPVSNDSRWARSCWGLLGSFVAWVTAVGIMCVPVVIPLAQGIPQYDLRWSFVISISTSVLMAVVLFSIFCYCNKKKPPPQLKELRPGETRSTTNPGILRPSVFRAAPTSDVNDERLPLSVILTGGKKLHSEGLNGEGVRVAVIDSGVDQNHSGFRGRVKKQIWLRSGTPLEEDDHGTHVAGTIHLMAPEAEIYDYRVFGKDGSLSVDQAVAKAIRDATDEKCKVINMSLGGPFPSDEIWEAVQYAAKRGVVLVAAAGNEGDNNPLTNEISFPASYKECLSIAAVAKVDGLPVAVFSNSNPLVDYAGIGVDVTSFKPGGGFQNMSGTSMACPHVAGLVACLMTNGLNSADRIRDTLDRLAIDIDVAGIDNATGVGFVTYLDEGAFDQVMPRKARAGPSTAPSR